MPSEPVVVGWVAVDAPRMEIARVARQGGQLVATGTQLGPGYELRYQLEPRALTVQLDGGPARLIELGDADFFDLAWSPLFNSLPVLRDGLHAAGPPRAYRMLWVNVPSLAVEQSEQAYRPCGDGVVEFSAGEFTARLTFDDDGFVRTYPGLGRRVYNGAEPGAFG